MKQVNEKTHIKPKAATKYNEGEQTLTMKTELSDPAEAVNENQEASAKTGKLAVFMSKFEVLSDKLAPHCDWLSEKIFGKETIHTQELDKATAAPVRFGIGILVVFFGFFGGWAALAPLNSAAISSGTVVVSSNKKTLQHLEGGIISELAVKEGDYVEEGQVLLRLNETSAKARNELYYGQWFAAKAMESRLIAERDGLETVVFPDELWSQKENEDVFKILDGEQRLFEARRDDVDGRSKILQQRVEQLRDEIDGLEAQDVAVADQLVLITEEIDVVRILLARGNAQRPRLLGLQRKAAELAGAAGEYQSLIAKAKQTITSAEIEKINIRTQMLNEVVTDLRNTQSKIADLKEQQFASKDILDRVVITAPQSGIVTGMKYHTIGGVVSPGAPIMDIVPQDDKLVIEAMVKPQDIDVVHIGLDARVRLTAFKARQVPILVGKVTHLSADKFVDETTGAPYYKARVEISEEKLASLTKQVELYPGMPADVLIVTGERTMLSYLFAPITESMTKSFREE